MYQLSRLLEIALSPAAFIALIAFAFWLLAVCKSPRLLVWTFAGPLFVSTLGKYRFIKADYVAPLNHFEDYSRQLFVVLLSALVIGLISNRRLRRGYKGTPSTFHFLIFQLHFAFLMFSNGVENGILAAPVFLLSFSAVALLENTASSVERRLFCVEAVVLAGILFTTACLYQWLLAPQNAVWAGRFIGITHNSVHTAQFLSLFIVPSLYLMTVSRSSAARFSLLLFVTLQFALLAYTGSRTGLLMTLLPIVILFRHRSRRLIPAGIILSIALVLAIYTFPDSGNATSRLTSTENTRSGVYQFLWSRFLDNPILGDIETFHYDGARRVRVRENSYLMVAASMGVVGMTVFGLFLSNLLISMRMLFSLPNKTGKPLFRDFILASLMSILVGAFFEGFLFAIVGPCYLLLLLYAGLAGSLAKESVSGFRKSHHDRGVPLRA